jgi:hypothetical protein
VEKTGAPGERPLDCWARFRVGHKPCLVGRVGRHVALGDGVWLVTRRTLEIADGVAMTSPGSGLVSARLAEASQSAGGFPPPMFRQDVVTFLMAMSRLASMLATRVSICPKASTGNACGFNSRHKSSASATTSGCQLAYWMSYPMGSPSSPT